ncbi:ATP-binding protein [Candidatus Latescibacterota bacterium]
MGDLKRGWGLELMGQFMDDVRIESGPEGTTLTMTKRR